MLRRSSLIVPFWSSLTAATTSLQLGVDLLKEQDVFPTYGRRHLRLSTLGYASELMTDQVAVDDPFLQPGSSAEDSQHGTWTSPRPFPSFSRGKIPSTLDF